IDSSETVTRSEEELRTGTRQREAGQVRVRKYVDTEKVQTTVPTSREEVTVERVPVSEGTSTEAEFSEGELTVPIVEEEAVVEKRPVVKEELRVSKETVTGEETVEGDVRKERIDIDEEGSTTSSTETTR
ncbi:MAG: YsnF/AvaK domain-containing protein, partial [Actinobacteria bacterium]|nr:YsnF/AvaK domain-containing protein [Actinomycetota bacterium]